KEGIIQRKFSADVINGYSTGQTRKSVQANIRADLGTLSGPLVARIMALQSKDHIESITNFIWHITIEYRRKAEKLHAAEAQQCEDDESEGYGLTYSDMLYERWCSLEEIRLLAEQWAIVALYRAVELDTKLLLQRLNRGKK